MCKASHQVALPLVEDLLRLGCEKVGHTVEQLIDHLHLSSVSLSIREVFITIVEKCRSLTFLHNHDLTSLGDEVHIVHGRLEGDHPGFPACHDGLLQSIWLHRFHP